MSRGEAGLSLSVYVALTYIPVGGLLCVFCERGLLFFVCRSAFTPPRTDLPWLVGLYIRSEVYAFFLSLFLGTLEMVCPHSSRARSFVSCHWRAVTSPVAVARKLDLFGIAKSLSLSEIPSGFEDRSEFSTQFCRE